MWITSQVKLLRKFSTESLVFLINDPKVKCTDHIYKKKKKKSPSISPQISWFLCPMNLNTHSSNETAIYSYVTPLNNTLTGLNQRPDISQPQTSYSNNYFQLSSNEKFEILKSISVSYANPYAVNQLVSSGQPLGHHYMSSPILSQQLPQVCLIFFFMITMLLLT